MRLMIYGGVAIDVDDVISAELAYARDRYTCKCFVSPSPFETC